MKQHFLRRGYIKFCKMKPVFYLIFHPRWWYTKANMQKVDKDFDKRLNKFLDETDFCAFTHLSHEIEGVYAYLNKKVEVEITVFNKFSITDKLLVEKPGRGFGKGFSSPDYPFPFIFGLNP